MESSEKILPGDSSLFLDREDKSRANMVTNPK